MKTITRKSFIYACIIFILVFGLHFNASHAASPFGTKQIDYDNLNKYLKSGKQSTIMADPGCKAATVSNSVVTSSAMHTLIPESTTA